MVNREHTDNRVVSHNRVVLDNQVDMRNQEASDNRWVDTAEEAIILRQVDLLLLMALSRVVVLPLQ